MKKGVGVEEVEGIEEREGDRRNGRKKGKNDKKTEERGEKKERREKRGKNNLFVLPLLNHARDEALKHVTLFAKLYDKGK